MEMGGTVINRNEKHGEKIGNGGSMKWQGENEGIEMNEENDWKKEEKRMGREAGKMVKMIYIVNGMRKKR